MNSYNENLHSTVVAALQAQELDTANMQAKRNTSIFTLYFAGGAKITAAERLEKAEKEYRFQKAMKEQAVVSNNISINLQTCAGQQKTYTAQAVTNTAVAAANIQVATNAVVKLAADMASIYSIVNAADFGTEIYSQSEEAQRRMNDTACEAEMVSQLSMEASMLTSEVSSATVSDQATAVNTAMTAMRGIISADYDSYYSTVNADHETLTTASATEKVAEGDLEFINVEAYAAEKAYTINNKELNLDLNVPPSSVTQDAYTVQFNYYESAFPKVLKGAQIGKKQGEEAGYPVDKYYIMLVKNNKKTLFSLSNAENIVFSEMTERYVEVDGRHLKKDKTVKRDLSILSMQDTDGEAMQPGTDYVVIVLAVFTPDYKKTLNVFSDYLSAPSTKFSLTNKLISPAADTIVVTNNYTEGTIKTPTRIFINQTLEFYLGTTNPDTVEYRCMFLPVTSSFVKGMLSAKGLRTLQAEIDQLEKIADTLDPEIDALGQKVATLESNIAAKINQIHAIETEIKETSDKKKLAELKEELAECKSELQDWQKDLTTKKAQLDRLNAEKAKAIAAIDPAVDIDPGFFFNLQLAEQVSGSCYTKATTKVGQKEGKDKKMYPVLIGTVTLTDSTLDNFGNPLIKGKEYVPVVLSFANVPKSSMKQFTNSLSAFEDTKKFEYIEAAN